MSLSTSASKSVNVANSESGTKSKPKCLATLLETEAKKLLYTLADTVGKADVGKLGQPWLPLRDARGDVEAVALLNTMDDTLA